MSANAICSTLVGGVLMVPLYWRMAFVAQELSSCMETLPGSLFDIKILIHSTVDIYVPSSLSTAELFYCYRDLIAFYK